MSNIIKKYPILEVNLAKFTHNINTVVGMCEQFNVNVAGIFKGFHAIPEMVKAFDSSKCAQIGSSRIEQLKLARDLDCKKPLFLIRIPMISEMELVADYADYSLQSELISIETLNRICIEKNKLHKVVLMVDLGDLREGYWDKDELISVAMYVEKNLSNIELAGIGTNLGCYGSVEATPEKMNELCNLAEKLENILNRPLEIISGGGTTSTPMIFNGTMPSKINHLRIGEGIILSYDYGALFGVDASFLNQDVFTLKAEIIELKTKPSYPIGKLSFDAFGNVPTYVDRGLRKRALLGIGKVDFGSCPEILIPQNKNVEILGASSDHLILDIENCAENMRVGDIVNFDLCYATMVYLTSSDNVTIEIVS